MQIRPEDMKSLRYALNKGVEGIQNALQMADDMDMSEKMKAELRAHLQTLARLRAEAERKDDAET